MIHPARLSAGTGQMPNRMRKRSTPAPEGRLLFQGGGLLMSHTICVFSDESGVFDKYEK